MNKENKTHCPHCDNTDILIHKDVEIQTCWNCGKSFIPIVEEEPLSERIKLSMYLNILHEGAEADGTSEGQIKHAEEINKVRAELNAMYEQAGEEFRFKMIDTEIKTYDPNKVNVEFEEDPENTISSIQHAKTFNEGLVKKGGVNSKPTSKKPAFNPSGVTEITGITEQDDPKKNTTFVMRGYTPLEQRECVIKHKKGSITLIEEADNIKLDNKLWKRIGKNNMFKKISKAVGNVISNNITPFIKKQGQSRISPIRFMSFCMFVIIISSNVTKLLYVFELVSRDLSNMFLATVNGLFLSLCGLNVWRSNNEVKQVIKVADDPDNDFKIINDPEQLKHIEELKKMSSNHVTNDNGLDAGFGEGE